MADICERWMWQPPGEIIERLMSRSVVRPSPVPGKRPVRDRYYTQARRLHWKRLMSNAR